MHDHDTTGTEPSESEARIATWRKVIHHLQRDPETFGLVLTLANLQQPPETVTFAEDNERYVALRAFNDDYIGLGKYAACSHCYTPIISWPDRAVDWPPPRHECWDWEKPTPAPHRSVTWRSPSGAP